MESYLPEECFLVFDVNKAEVVYITEELFGFHIRISEHRRYVYFEHGAAIQIEGQIKLTGSLDTNINKILGDIVGEAFKAVQSEVCRNLRWASWYPTLYP